MGDLLKTEQLCFLYDVVKIIYETALRNALLNMKEEVLQEVIPRLAVYCTLLHMRRILDVKEEEKKHGTCRSWSASPRQNWCRWTSWG